ncbi:MAG: presenilin family intramembrane aspartyl protease [Nanoarchaeota archaeon]|nr:presenilin family intramembrane aspartyl protease [Nanoarchaeota archaeon]
MKHTRKITSILILMFVLTQLIGLLVIYAYTPLIEQVEINGTLQNQTLNPLPYGLESPDVEQDISLISIIIAFAIAVGILFVLTKFRAAIILKIWFFIVTILVLAITFVAFEHLVPWQIPYKIAMIAPLAIALPLAIFKIFKRNLIVHNFTELLIYPGIASVFVPLLGLGSIIILLILISLYDMWAVWHSGFMQKMAKFQMEELKVFTGFFVPYLSKSQRKKLKKLKQESNLKKTSKKPVNMKVNLAILGGGDIVFPIITAGIILRLWGLIPALLVITFATLALLGLFSISKKGKFYPAMPFISAGLFVGIILGYLFTLI